MLPPAILLIHGTRTASSDESQNHAPAAHADANEHVSHALCDPQPVTSLAVVVQKLENLFRVPSAKEAPADGEFSRVGLLAVQPQAAIDIAHGKPTSVDLGMLEIPPNVRNPARCESRVGFTSPALQLVFFHLKCEGPITYHLPTQTPLGNDDIGIKRVIHSRCDQRSGR